MKTNNNTLQEKALKLKKQRRNRIIASLYGAQNETYIEGWEKKASNLLIYKRLCKI